MTYIMRYNMNNTIRHNTTRTRTRPTGRSMNDVLVGIMACRDYGVTQMRTQQNKASIVFNYRNGRLYGKVERAERGTPCTIEVSQPCDVFALLGVTRCDQ